MEDKEKLLKELESLKLSLQKVIDSLEVFGTGDAKQNRTSKTDAVFALFNFMEGLTSAEVNFYNYFYRRG